MKGQIYAWGINIDGQLGLGDFKNRYIPTLAPNFPNDIIQISTGNSHMLALANDGRVYSRGDNEYGQLGDNNDRNIPTLVPKILNNIIQISASEYHSLALTNDGHVYSFGFNEFRQLGLGDDDGRNIPTLISDINNIVQISTGGDRSSALTNTGKIYSWGDNHYGQLGLGHYNDINIPTLIAKMPNNIIQISAGNGHSLVLSANGQIYAFGKNDSGQLGFGDNKDRTIPTLISNFNVLS